MNLRQFHVGKAVGFFALAALVGAGAAAYAFYADTRPPEGPMTEQKPPEERPVAENPEGEADPSRMTLTMTEWRWVSALYNDGRTVGPKAFGDFTLTFTEDSRFTADTDCNQMGGSYSADGDALTFSDIYMTKMYCEGSMEETFALLLRDTAHYHFTSRGELILDLKFDSGSAVFR